jgi:hypothetical protein
MNTGIDGSSFSELILSYDFSTDGFAASITLATESMTSGRFY